VNFPHVKGLQNVKKAVRFTHARVCVWPITRKKHQGSMLTYILTSSASLEERSRARHDWAFLFAPHFSNRHEIE